METSKSSGLNTRLAEVTEMPDFMNKFTLARSSNAYDPATQTYYSNKKPKSKGEYSINQNKLNLNININYSPTQQKLIKQKNATKARILKNKLKVDKAINSFMPDITFGDKKFRKQDDMNNTAQPQYYNHTRYN